MGHHHKNKNKKHQQPSREKKQDNGLSETELYELKCQNEAKHKEQANKRLAEIWNKHPTDFDCEAFSKTQEENENAINDYSEIIKNLIICDDNCKALAAAYHHLADLLLYSAKNYQQQENASLALDIIQKSIILQEEIMPESKENKAIAQAFLKRSQVLRSELRKICGLPELIQSEKPKEVVRLDPNRFFNQKEDTKKKAKKDKASKEEESLCPSVCLAMS